MKLSHDIHNNIATLNVITPQAVGTTGSANGKTSAILDRKGYGSVEFLYHSGASATVADTITPVVFEADATGSTFTSAASTDLIGTEAALTLTTAGVKGRVGYKGNKRYLKFRLYGVGTATAVVAAQAVLSTPEAAPVA